MTIIEICGWVIGGGTASAGGVWAWLTQRDIRKAKADDNKLFRENTAVGILTARVVAMETEIKALQHNLLVYRRVAHDMSGLASAAQLVLVTKFIEVNDALTSSGKPARYANPVAAAMAEVSEITKTLVEEQRSVYEKAERDTTAEEIKAKSAKEEGLSKAEII